MKWYDIRDYKDRWRTFNIVISGRGIGKTYSSICYAIEENKGKFIYLRDTAEQIIISASNMGNPFKKYNANTGRDIQIIKSNNLGSIVDKNNELELLGYALPLSTFENLRGVDFSDVTLVIFDEFIEKKKLIFDQFDAFQNFYETVNRNRELEGEKPLLCFLFSNARKLSSPILEGYDLIPEIEGMLRSGQRNYSRQDIWLNMPESEISELKKNTAQYRAAAGTTYYEEALNNKFANDSFYGIGRKKLIEYTGFCKIDDTYIYRHKSNGSFYCCRTKCENVAEYDSKINYILLYRNVYPALDLAYAEGRLFFSDFMIKENIMKILK